MSLWYLKPSIELAVQVNAILYPAYCNVNDPYTINYIPTNGAMFTTVDGSQLMLSPTDPQFTQEEQALIQLMLDGKKTPEEADALGWYDATDN